MGMADPAKIDPTDPVFISYRQSDGTEITADLAWLLRAAGIPVWRDRDDLPPGDTAERLAQAIDDGLSGAVLVITPDIIKSNVVKEVEAPRLIELHQKHPEFALGIANAVQRAPGKADYTAPDRLLELPSETLEGTDQKPTDPEGLRALVQGLLWHRAAEHRALVAADASTFSLSVQTRNVAQVYDRTGGQLDIRVRPSAHERLPDGEGLRDLALTIGLLPDAVTRSGAQRVRLTGGAHLSVAFAIGAALPSSRVGHLDVGDQRGATWSSGDEATLAQPALLQVKDEGAATAVISGRAEVAVYLDMLPNPSDAAHERFLEEHGAAMVAWQKIVSAQPGLLNPGQAAALAGEATARIRALSTANANAHVHLLLRCPFPIAVLVGRLTNTLRVTVYEWDDSDPPEGNDYRARFVPAMNVRASAAGGVITDVLL
jgi:SMODS-associated and fused to various effectors sensor domain/TIR domain